LDQNVTNLRILELLTENYGVAQTYTTLCKYIQKHFPKTVEAFGVQITAPGEEAELDFGYLGMLPGKDGRKVKTWGLAVILSYSRGGYYAICYDQKLDTLCSELKQAFTYFGGVPKKLKVDNMKAAVQRNQRYELEFNQDFLEFARHYTTVIVPCTPHSPEQKGKVESGIKYLQQNFVNGRVFTDSRDIKRKLKDWMTTYANQRVHGTTRKVPWRQLLEHERKALQSLPKEEFCLFQREVRKAQPNCHIHFDNVYYSVPFKYVGKEVTVRYNDHLIRVIDQGEQVALHVRSFEKGEYVTVRAHLPEYKIYSETERQAKIEAQMRQIGESAHEYFRVLLATKESYWFRSIRVILGLSKQYGVDAVNLSLKRALYYKATDVVTIKHILEKKLYEASLEPMLPKEDKTDNALCRNLSYYSLS
jgi:Integrase core domain/Mu transposase, C-terminal